MNDSPDSAAALARAVALMEIAGREHKLLRAGRKPVTLSLAAANTLAWGFALIASALILHA